MMRGCFNVVSLLLLLYGCVNGASVISVEQFYSPLESSDVATSQRGWLNGFGEPEKVCILAGMAAISSLSTVGGYVIPCISRLSPTVEAFTASRVPRRVPSQPVLTGVWVLLIEGGRGSGFVAPRRSLYWIWSVKKFPHWTGGVHGHGC
jgi:hypothetical protein